MSNTTYVGINYIVKTPGNLGGRARIDGRRIGVSDVVDMHLRLNASLQEIVEAFDVTLAQIHAALAYYYDHSEEIDSYLDEEARITSQIIEEKYGGEEGLMRRKAELEERFKERHPERYKEMMETRNQHQDKLATELLPRKK